MSVWKIDLGSQKTWRVVCGIAVLCGIVWPIPQIAYWHLQNHGPSRCGLFSVSIPFLWTSIASGDFHQCSEGLYLLKHAPTVFGSKDEGSTLSVIEGQSHLLDVSKNSPLLRAFYESNQNVVPFVFAHGINHCLKGTIRKDSKGTVAVLCDLQDGHVLQFTGSEHALKQVPSMIKSD
jgi:hypothetical protein